MTINLDNVLEYYGDITLPIMEEVLSLHPECTHIRLSEHTVIPGTNNMDMIVSKYRELQGLDKTPSNSIHNMFDDMIDVYYNGQ